MKYEKIIFVGEDNTSVSPMAEAIMRSYVWESMEVSSRGLVVLFEEPYHPYATKILNDKGLMVLEGSTKPLMQEDISSKHLILTTDLSVKEKIFENFQMLENIYTIGEFADEKCEISVPYGMDIESYYEVYETLSRLLIKIKDKLKEDM